MAYQAYQQNAAAAVQQVQQQSAMLGSSQRILTGTQPQMQTTAQQWNQMQFSRQMQQQQSVQRMKQEQQMFYGNSPQSAMARPHMAARQGARMGFNPYMPPPPNPMGGLFPRGPMTPNYKLAGQNAFKRPLSGLHGGQRAINPQVLLSRHNPFNPMYQQSQLTNPFQIAGSWSSALNILGIRNLFDRSFQGVRYNGLRGLGPWSSNLSLLGFA